ncbi:MBOAT family O-acyltransferase [Maribacter sp. MAR_2009_72]|uniref:MBOAT family O-acyltransferase n=1 Tax=Maribacter sp. MAR_2009_72 TaxID=1250050 RepID=UPI00119A3315|nr:MBOAT family O-acyltransferase [Maribacter sp. MAR_2009_72]TVZ16949.1 D-alanyl-lipoteichoic acid acyltransferase DltB (MBOAT superfamily) [Maribacter sp. MAR_2009_72]
MLFNSIDFAIFLPIFFFIYWFVVNKNLKLQNFSIVIASYIFYGWWDTRFLILILFSTIVDYSIGIALKKEEREKTRKLLLLISILINLGFLGFFKYYNFFLENFVAAFSLFGTNINANTLNIILPVGISFYTFQTLSYTIDVYKRKLEPINDFVVFSAFVSFFPQLVAGPIERATHLLPQFQKQRTFNYALAVDGLKQMLWGLFKKMVIADNAAQRANEIFDNAADFPGSTLVLGAILFAFQIYGDFSGYSDIAIGCSRLFGFNLKQNFAHPYFSRDMAEFWRRWHISLSTWFRDYLYIPLGGSRYGMLISLRNTFVIFIVSGFWHGANWTFIAWGILNAIYFTPLLLFKKNRVNTDIVAEGKNLPSFKELIQMLTTFSLTVFGWIFFRAENIEHAWLYITGIFSKSFFSIPYLAGIQAKYTMILIPIFIIIEWIGRSENYAIAKLCTNWKLPYRYAFYYLIILSILIFMGGQQEFIYFQF